MLASHKAYTSSYDMADDSMEISSEHGQIGGDDDIDIDIDLMAGQADEDYILEDATSNVDFGDDFQHNASFTAVGTDDLMIDDDDGGGSFEMGDADLLQEEQVHGTEHDAMPFTDTNASHFEQNQADISHVPAVESHQEVQEADFVYQEGPSYETGGNEFEVEEVRVASPYEDVRKGKAASEIVKTDTKEETTRHSPANSPHGQNFKSPLGVQAPQSPPISDHNPPDDTTENQNSGNIIDASLDEAAQLVDTAPVASVPKNLDAKYDEIIVYYMKSEYALFSTSDVDDPDSYFLSDKSVVEQPLSALFAAIREILHDELTEEDELWMTFNELNAEIEEVSLSNQLHEK
jgi:hypothetical protein